MGPVPTYRFGSVLDSRLTFRLLAVGIRYLDGDGGNDDDDLEDLNTRGGLYHNNTPGSVAATYDRTMLSLGGEWRMGTGLHFGSVIGSGAQGKLFHVTV